MKNDTDVLVFNNNIKNVGFTGVGDRYSKRKAFLIEELPPAVADVETTFSNEDESDLLQVERMKIVFPSNNIDILEWRKSFARIKTTSTY